MGKKQQYFALAIVLLGLILNSGCGMLFGWNIAGTWFLEVTGSGIGLTWVGTFSGSKGSGTASLEAYSVTYTGTYSKSGKTITIEVSSALGTISIDWEFKGHEDRADGTAVVNHTDPQETLTFTFNANRRNF